MASEWAIKREICDIGQRLYRRQFAAGNDGNISYRLSEEVVVCTPTQICKGFMKPDDLCTIDFSGRQISGRRKPTSETLLHLEIYRGDPSVRSVVHCHPPHATAFGMAGEDIPTCVLPEVEVFLGVVPRAAYATPGSEQFAETVRPHIGHANTVVLSNHGTVSWGPSVERAYWHTEILDAYCRMLLLAKQIGSIQRLPEPAVDKLLDLKEQFGAGVDPRRSEGKALCVNTCFGRPEAGSCAHAATGGTDASGADDAESAERPLGSASEAAPRTPADRPDEDQLVRLITERVVEALAAGEGDPRS